MRKTFLSDSLSCLLATAQRPLNELNISKQEGKQIKKNMTSLLNTNITFCPTPVGHYSSYHSSLEHAPFKKPLITTEKS